MKKLYAMPTVELTKFDVEDIITASGGEGGSTDPVYQTAASTEAFVSATDYTAAAEWNSNWVL